MLLFADLLERIRNPNRVKHIDPAIEAVAKSFADDFGFPDRAPSLAEAMQDAFNDWLDEQEQADRKASPTAHTDDCGIRTRGICDCGEWP